MIRNDTVLLDSELHRQALRLQAHLSDDELDSIPALAPSDMRRPLVLTTGYELVDGCHRIIGIARWAREQGIDLDEGEPIELPAILVPEERICAEHPEDSTPDWLVDRWVSEAA